MVRLASIFAMIMFRWWRRQPAKQASPGLEQALLQSLSLPLRPRSNGCCKVPPLHPLDAAKTEGCRRRPHVHPIQNVGATACYCYHCAHPPREAHLHEPKDNGVEKPMQQAGNTVATMRRSNPLHILTSRHNKYYFSAVPMDSVRLCAAKLGYTVIERNIASKAVSDVYAELEVITRVCAKAPLRY